MLPLKHGIIAGMPSNLKWTYRPFDMTDKRVPSVACSCSEPHQRDFSVTDQATQAVTPQHWPTEPEPLADNPHYDILMNVYDGFLCAVPLFLIVKTTFCIHAYNLDKENRGDFIDRVSFLTTFLLSFNGQLVTAFTIVFVTIMSTLVKRLALYKAQEGATVSDLEQLQASISLPSTIKMVFSLRKFTKFSAVLVAVWSFYYLGSQSSKREYGYAPSDPYRRIRAAYATDDVGYWVDFSLDSRDTEWLNRQLHSSREYLRSKSSTPGVDGKGYVLVPSIDSSSYLEAIEDSQWVDIQPSYTYYSAFAGRPLAIEPQLTSSIGGLEYWEDKRIMGDYVFNATYMDVRCGSVEIHPESVFPPNVTPGMWTSINKTSTVSSNLPLVLVDVWGRWNESYGQLQNGSEILPPVNINGSTSGSIKVTCNITNPSVKLRVHCSESACLAKAMQHITPNATEQFTHPLANDTFADVFFSSLLLSDGPPLDYFDTPVTMLVGPWSVLQTMMVEGSDAVDINDAVQEMGSNLGEYINTYYNLALLSQPGAKGVQNPGPDDGFALVSVNGSLYDPHYALSWAWIAISYVSDGILFAAAIYSFWLRRRTLAPDVFGYVSTLTRDNPHLMIPDGGSTMSGIDRAKFLQDVKIRISDVHGQHGNIGKVGLTFSQDCEGFGPLRKERKYL